MVAGRKLIIAISLSFHEVEYRRGCKSLQGKPLASALTGSIRSHSETFGRRPVRLRHKLQDNPLFSDGALARLIEITPRDQFHVNTMPRESMDARGWREGDIRGISGKAVLEAVSKGNIWVHLQRVQQTSDSYAALLEAIYEEIEACIPSFRSFKRSMSILVSSPRMNVAYHADVPGQCLWQVRGKKRIWLYPAREPFLPQRTLEDIVLRRTFDTDFSYEPSFDDAAEIYDLQPGDWMSWQHNGPHRVTNEDCLCVSLTTEHWTDELRGTYAIDYANGLMRPFIGDRTLSRETSGPAFWAKFALAGAHKMLRSKSKARLPLAVDFHVNPSSPDGFVDVAPYQILK
jgi:hypothetical protein